LLKTSFPDISFEVKLAFRSVLLVDIVPDDIGCDIADRAEELTSAPHTAFPIITPQKVWKGFEEHP